MSYDLYYWRGRAEGKPEEIVKRLLDGEAVEGIQEIQRDEVLKAFRGTFGEDFGKEDSEEEWVLGPGFSVILPPAPIRLMTILCAWGLLKTPDRMKAMESVAMVGLRCNRYNPQVDEFVEIKNADPGDLVACIDRMMKVGDLRYSSQESGGPSSPPQDGGSG